MAQQTSAGAHRRRLVATPLSFNGPTWERWKCPHLTHFNKCRSHFNCGGYVNAGILLFSDSTTRLYFSNMWCFYSLCCESADCRYMVQTFLSNAISTAHRQNNIFFVLTDIRHVSFTFKALRVEAAVHFYYLVRPAFLWGFIKRASSDHQAFCFP